MIHWSCRLEPEFCHDSPKVTSTSRSLTRSPHGSFSSSKQELSTVVHSYQIQGVSLPGALFAAHPLRGALPAERPLFFLEFFSTTAFFHEHFFSFPSASPSSHTCPTINFPFDGAHLPGILSRAQRSPSAASLNHHPRPRWQLNHPSAA